MMSISRSRFSCRSIVLKDCLYYQAARHAVAQSWEADLKNYVDSQDHVSEPFKTRRRTLSSALLATAATDSKSADQW